MTRFLSAGVIIGFLIVLRVLLFDTNPGKALDKYSQAVNRVTENYVDEPDMNVLLRGSIAGLVRGLRDTTLVLTGTPLDTSNVPAVQNTNALLERFSAAWKYALDQRPNLNADSLGEQAIRGMLQSLDPHSVYINPTASARVLEDFQGQFSGIGLSYELVRDTATVIYVMDNGPAFAAGMFPGDKLLALDTLSIVSASTDKIRELMRGPENSYVSIVRLRHGSTTADTVEVKRAPVPIKSIEASFMIDSQTGYIRMNRFSATTHTEFVEATELLRKQGMKKLLLDLRNNGGGYLQQALLIVDEFLDGRQPVLSTKSRHRQFNNSYNSSRNGKLHGMPLMILVNQSSASASEIVAGALQDYDRALIVGRRTFGKGLVQQQYLLNDRSIIRVTTSRYYTPSGRLIQKPYINGREAYASEIRTRSNDASSDIRNYVEQIPDSLVFRTRSGRPVYGGGGIIPDHILVDTLRSPLLDFVRRGRHHYPLLFGWMQNYGTDKVKRDLIPNQSRFAPANLFSSADEQQFRDSILKSGISFLASDDSTTRSTMDRLEISRANFDREFQIVMDFMQVELSRMIWGTSGYWQASSQRFDQSIVESRKLWDEYDQLSSRIVE
jgi:carboxyl-terminal processing protease